MRSRTVEIRIIALTPPQAQALAALLEKGCCTRRLARPAPMDTSGGVLVALKQMELAAMRVRPVGRDDARAARSARSRRLWWLTPHGCVAARDLILRGQARSPAPHRANAAR